MIILFVVLPLVVAGILPLVGKLSRRVLPDLLANATMLFLLVYGAVLFAILYPGLKKMRVPVVAYILAISAMARG